jgi:hypothetical protein
MKDQDVLENLQKELVEDFCGPFQGKQKEECVNYYKEWIGKEEKQEQTGEQM